MMFEKKPLKIQVLHRNEETINDEREILLYKLMQEYPQFQQFERLKIYTTFDEKAQPIDWYQMKITPFKICIEEENE